MKTLVVVLAFILLIAIEVLKVYYIMPFPGSQHDETISVAYFIHHYIIFLRIFGWLFLLYALFKAWGQTSLVAKIIFGILLAFYLFVIVLFNLYFVADHIFYQLKNKTFLQADKSVVDQKQLIIGVSINGESKAYPIEIIGYHHQVRDTVGGEPVMVTYCTVCRTGRVFSPIVDGQIENFRLVGMDHFNAMFEDSRTKSWWRQVNGEAIAGAQKGKHLKEIAAEQMSLRAWLDQHLDSKILQPDTLYNRSYQDLANYDEGNIRNGLEKSDSLAWQNKSWVVGVQLNGKSRAYDWFDLIKQRTINDTLGGKSIVVALESDSVSFHVWQRDSLSFSWDEMHHQLIDTNTKSTWNWQGESTAGQLQGKKLLIVQSYQEFWFSWKTFKPNTTQYKP